MSAKDELDPNEENKSENNTKKVEKSEAKQQQNINSLQ